MSDEEKDPHKIIDRILATGSGRGPDVVRFVGKDSASPDKESLKLLQVLATYFGKPILPVFPSNTTQVFSISDIQQYWAEFDKKGSATESNTFGFLTMQGASSNERSNIMFYNCDSLRQFVVAPRWQDFLDFMTANPGIRTTAFIESKLNPEDTCSSSRRAMSVLRSDMPNFIWRSYPSRRKGYAGLVVGTHKDDIVVEMREITVPSFEDQARAVYIEYSDRIEVVFYAPAWEAGFPLWDNAFPKVLQDAYDNLQKKTLVLYGDLNICRLRPDLHGGGGAAREVFWKNKLTELGYTELVDSSASHTLDMGQNYRFYIDRVWIKQGEAATSSLSGVLVNPHIHRAVGSQKASAIKDHFPILIYMTLEEEHALFGDIGLWEQEQELGEPGQAAAAASAPRESRDSPAPLNLKKRKKYKSSDGSIPDEKIVDIGAALLWPSYQKICEGIPCFCFLV